jgi:nucleoside-specific outer membrane channel protein Tsx
MLLALLWGDCSQALTWSDNSVGYRYGTAFAEPAIPTGVSKHIVSFTHASGYQHGSQFLTADVLLSDGNDPAANSTRGATEFYALYRHHFSLAALSGRSLSAGVVRDVALTVGGDWGSKDDAFASRTRKLRLGPTLNLAVPGFLDLGVYWQKEWNHNGIVGREVSFSPAPVLGAAWGLKFGSGAMPLEFKGFFDYSGAKGRDGFGNATRDELLLRAALMADVGIRLGRSNVLWLGAGYEHWNNKFGNRPGVGTRASTPMLMVELHL